MYRKGPVELRLGDYREVLAEAQGTVITDPPYSDRTHDGQRHGRRLSGSGNWCSTKALNYGSWSADDMRSLVGWGNAVASAGWMALFSDHIGAMVYDAEASEVGRTRFAPLSCVQVGMNVRLAGDGPSNWTTWLCVSRPRALRAWGTLPGAYVGNHAQQDAVVPGGKPLWLMRSIVRDYSRAGDLVVDPCAGGATTLIAAALEGRRAIGAELDPETFAKACARIERHALTPPLPGIEAVPMTQGSIDF